MKIETREEVAPKKSPILILRVTNLEGSIVGEVKFPRKEVERGIEIGTSRGWNLWGEPEFFERDLLRGIVSTRGKVLDNLERMVARVTECLPASEKGKKASESAYATLEILLGYRNDEYKTIPDVLETYRKRMALRIMIKELRGGYVVGIPELFAVDYQNHVPITHYLFIRGEDEKVKIRYCFPYEVIPQVEMVMENKRRKLLPTEQIVLEIGDKVTLDIPEAYTPHEVKRDGVLVMEKALLQVLYTES